MKEKQSVSVTVSNRTILRILVVTIVAYMGIRFIGQLSRPLTLIFVSMFLAIALNPAVSKLTHWLPSKSRVRATGVAYIFVLSVLIGFFSLIIPPLVQQTRDFIDEVPGIVRNSQDQDTALGNFVRRYKLEDQINSITSDISSKARDIRGPVLSTAGRIGGAVISIITVLVLTFMMLIEGPGLSQRIWALQTKERVERWRPMLEKMQNIIVRYVYGQLIVATLAGFFALVIMLIIGVPNAVALAGIVALIGLIPLIGNTIAAVIVVILTAFSSLKLALIMGIYFPIYQQIENATLQPYIQAKSNQLTALTVFIAALLGASVAGLLGAFVAIPMAGCFKLLAVDYYKRRKTSGAPAE